MQINSDFPALVPAWWIEGQAQLGGEVLGNLEQTTDSIDTEMIKLRGDYATSFRSGVTDLSKAEVIPLPELNSIVAHVGPVLSTVAENLRWLISFPSLVTIK